MITALHTFAGSTTRTDSSTDTKKLIIHLVDLSLPHWRLYNSRKKEEARDVKNKIIQARYSVHPGKIGFSVSNMDIKFILCDSKDLFEAYFCDDVDNLLGKTLPK